MPPSPTPLHQEIVAHLACALSDFVSQHHLGWVYFVPLDVVLIDKKALYEQFGVAEYWIVDPEAQMIEVYALEQGVYRLIGRFQPGERARSRLLAGFEIAVDEVVKGALQSS